MYTLSFDRLCDARHTARLCAKLRKARDTRAVVVCNPTSLKALTLKLVETFHLLAHARQIESAASASVAGKVAQGMGMILNAGKGMLRKLGGAGTRRPAFEPAAATRPALEAAAAGSVASSATSTGALPVCSAIVGRSSQMYRPLDGSFTA